jgi:hypothetical protein
MIFNGKNLPVSSYDDFRGERIDAAEMFDMLGGIERTAMIAGDVFDHTALESVWNVKYPDDDICSSARDRNIPANSNFFFAVRFFRTLVLYVCSRFRNKH